ncbi:MAG: cellulase N-terminal Ig-like domain-containing protein, partial [Ferruginibacter sp.]
MNNRHYLIAALFFLMLAFSFLVPVKQTSWIRINQLGYIPTGWKVAVWCSKRSEKIHSFKLCEAGSQKVVFEAPPSTYFGAYGPFENTCRLNFSSFKKPGRYYLQTGETVSPEFNIDTDVY